MTDTIKARAVEAMARAVCQERCAFMGEPPCWKVGEWPNTECDEPGCIAQATAALTALHRFHAENEMRMGVPVVATKAQRKAVASVALYAGQIYAAMITAARDPFAPEQEA